MKAEKNIKLLNACQSKLAVWLNWFFEHQIEINLWTHESFYFSIYFFIYSNTPLEGKLKSEIKL